MRLRIADPHGNNPKEFELEDDLVVADAADTAAAGHGMHGTFSLMVRDTVLPRHETKRIRGEGGAPEMVPKPLSDYDFTDEDSNQMPVRIVEVGVANR